MRLFLASHDFGDHQEAFLKLVGSGRKALLITNARDYYPDEKRASDVAGRMDTLRRAGLTVDELDLRKYFGRKAELASYIDSYAPDVIYVMGGNVFLLAAAFKLSGFDEKVRSDLAQDKYVYSGNSAGVMVTMKSLEYYGHGHLTPERVHEVYGIDATLEGLGLVDWYVIVHADVPEHLDVTELYKDRLSQAGKDIVILNQSSAVVIDGDDTTVLP